MNDIILLKLGELVLKGLNRRSFEDKLQANIYRRLNGLGQFRVYTRQSTTYVEPLDEGADFEGAWEAMTKLFGPVPGQGLPQGQGRHRRVREGVFGGADAGGAEL